MPLHQSGVMDRVRSLHRNSAQTKAPKADCRASGLFLAAKAQKGSPGPGARIAIALLLIAASAGCAKLGPSANHGRKFLSTTYDQYVSDVLHGVKNNLVAQAFVPVSKR